MAIDYIQPDTRFAHRETDAAAMRSFKFSLAFLLTPLPSLIAIYFGILGLDRTRNGAAEGRRWAVSGLLLGIAGVIYWIFVAIGLSWARSSMILMSEISNVHDLVPEISNYAMTHSGNLPANFADFQTYPMNLSSNVIFVAAGDNLTKLPTTAPIAFFDLSNRGEDRFIVLYADRHIATLPRAQAWRDLQMAYDRQTVNQRASTQPMS